MKHLAVIVISCLLISFSFGQANTSNSNSDYHHIKKEIENEYKRWLEKGEFEKSADFQIRINNTSVKSFDSICYDILIRSFKSKSDFGATLLKYDADNEKFGIEFNFNDVIFKSVLSVPINRASQFKEEFKDYKIYVEEKDWSFINGYLTPNKIIFSNGTKIKFDFSFSNKQFTDISFSVPEFSASVLNHNQHKFNYDEYYNKRMFDLAETGERESIIGIEENSYKSNDEDKIFSKVENEAEFPGGNAAWARYLGKSLGSFNPASFGAKPGKYQIIVRFIVGKDGSVSDVKAETNYGYAMEQMAIAAIKNGPKWKPALQNGRNVNAYRRQPITFIVEGKN